jgi:hypothetical protein
MARIAPTNNITEIRINEQKYYKHNRKMFWGFLNNNKFTSFELIKLGVVLLTYNE